MARRFWFATASSSVTVSPHASWAGVAGQARQLLTSPNVDSNAGAASANGFSPSRAVQQVSDPLPHSGTIAGTFTAVFFARRGTGTTGPIYPRILVRLVSGDGTIDRGVIFDATAAADIHSSSFAAGSQIITGPIAPTMITAGDRLVMEVGTVAASNQSAIPFYIGCRGPDLTGAGVVANPSSGRAWIEFSEDPLNPATPPAPPTSLTATPASPTTIDVTWAAPTSGPAPTGYKVQVDAGPLTDVGDVLAHQFTGLAPATPYTIKVYAYTTAGDSPAASALATTPAGRTARPGIAAQQLLAALGLDPDPDGADAPAQQWWDLDPTDVATYNASRSQGLAGYTITYGARTPLGESQPISIGVAVVVPLGDTIEIGDRFQIRLADAVATELGLDPDEQVRGTGIVTDVEADPTRVWTLPGYGDVTLYQVTATGLLPRYAAQEITPANWPTEPGGQRIARILARLGLTGTVDTTGPDLIPPSVLDPDDVVPVTAARLLDTTTASLMGRLTEQRHGVVDWHDRDHRRGTLPALTATAGEILGTGFTWRQTVGDVVNSAEVTYGLNGDVVRVIDPGSADPRTGVGPYPQAIATALADEEDAYTLGADLVGRRARPYPQLPAVTLDVTRSGLDTSRLAALFALGNGDRVALTDMPAGSPWDTLPRGCFVEGTIEHANPYAWRITLVVSDPALSGVSLRYIDVTNGATYADVAPALTYLDVARLEDPDDLL